MSITSNLRRQHTEILALASEIRGALQQDPAGIESIEKLLPALTGKIKIHLAMEDNALYPLLLDAAEAETRRLAADYLNEMGILRFYSPGIIRNGTASKKSKTGSESSAGKPKISSTP